MCFPLVLGFGRWRAVLVRACLLVAGVQFDGLLSGQGLGMSVSSGRAAGREQAALGERGSPHGTPSSLGNVGPGSVVDAPAASRGGQDHSR